MQIPIETETLANGLRVTYSEDHVAPLVAVNLWYHVGSANEREGRTGFAHLFEHMLFQGSANVEANEHFELVQRAGGTLNGSTWLDRTNYYETVPSNQLAIALWLEADRMGSLLPAMTQQKLDTQRDVVKNERRQGVENQPYGMVGDIAPPLMYPASHPYSWTVIGSMADLSAASLEDVKDFFRRYYAPNNATIVVAGDVKADSVRAIVREYFSEIPRGPAIERPAPAPFTVRDTAVTLEDRVQLARLYLNWHTVKATDADAPALQLAAYVLAGARTSRLTQDLVYSGEVATTVQAYNDAKRLDGDFSIVATARPGVALDTLQSLVDRNIQRLATDGPTTAELQQARNVIEAAFLRSIQTVSGKADQLNEYYYQSGNPDGFQDDLDRLQAVTTADIQRVVRKYLQAPRVMISVVPQGKPALAATKKQVTP